MGDHFKSLRSNMKLIVALSALAGFAASQNVICEAPTGFNYVPAKYPVGAKGDIIDKKALAGKYGDKLKATLEKIQEQKKVKLLKEEQKLERQNERAAIKAKKKVLKQLNKNKK